MFAISVITEKEWTRRGRSRDMQYSITHYTIYAEKKPFLSQKKNRFCVLITFLLNCCCFQCWCWLLVFLSFSFVFFFSRTVAIYKRYAKAPKRNSLCFTSFFVDDSCNQFFKDSPAAIYNHFTNYSLVFFFSCVIGRIMCECVLKRGTKSACVFITGTPLTGFIHEYFRSIK